MRNVELLETQNFRAAAREVMDGRASHAADAQDDYIE